MLRNIFFILAFVLCTNVFAEDKAEPKDSSAVPAKDASASEGKKASYIICKHAKDVRTVQVVPKKDEGCTVSYTKAGVEGVVADSKWKGRCFDVLHNVQTNLEKAGWSCKDISDARVSSVEGY